MKFIWIFFAVLLSGCGHLFFYPTQVQHYDPKEFHLEPKDIWFKTEKNDDIHAWYFESAKKPALGTILFFHGNAENLSSHFANLAWIPDEGYNYLIFDYPGYGKSPGSPTMEDCVESGRAALKWVHENIEKRPIIFAQSLGGAIAQRVILDLKDQIPIRSIVFEGTFTSYKAIARKKLSLSWMTWIFQPLAYVLVSDSWAADEDRLETISPIPVLVIHNQEDRAVEPVFGDRLFEHLAEPKEFWKIETGYHMDTFWRHQFRYRKPFLEWLAKNK
jgi:hypothetical protein